MYPVFRSGVLTCTPWGDEVWHHSWIIHEAADCNVCPQRLPSLFLHRLALPNYVSKCFYFDANQFCEELENKPEKDTPACAVCPWLGMMPPLMGCGTGP